MKRKRLSAVTAVAMVALIVALFGFASTAFAQVPPYESGNFCVADYPVNPINCTAGDFGLKQLRTVSIIETCSGGTVGEFEVVFDAVLTSTGPDRYDASFFIDLSGSPDGALLGDDCLHGYLAPPLTETPTYVNDPLNPDSVGNDTIFYGPWWNGEPKVPVDTCGDMVRQSHTVIRLDALRLPCVDNDLDGYVDVHTCAGYRNNQQWDCTDVKGAFPDTPSKCGCSYFNFPFQPTAIELASFSAATQGGDVLVSWETATELDNLGFSIYRSGAVGGAQTRLNDRLIPSKAPGNAVGASYSFLDESAVAGQTYFYWLEDVDVNGVASKAGPAEISLPFAKALPGRGRPAPIPFGVR